MPQGAGLIYLAHKYNGCTRVSIQDFRTMHLCKWLSIRALLGLCVASCLPGCSVLAKSQNVVTEPNGITRFSSPIMVPDATLHETRVFNPTVIVEHDRLAMLYRVNVEGKPGSQIDLAFSNDGKSFQPASFNPVLTDPAGVEDPRVVFLRGRYQMTYVCNRTGGPQQPCLATSTDLVHWDRKGVLLVPSQSWDAQQVKAAVIAPQKINGKYLMYFVGQTKPWLTSIGIATSTDLVHWHESTNGPVMTARPDHFDSMGVEPGPAPIILRRGILLVYNGWNRDHVHKTGWVLFSKKDGATILARSEEPLIEPNFPYEIEGRNAFTFTEGLVRYQGKWRFYYGAADRSIGMAETANLRNAIDQTARAMTKGQK